MHYVDSCRYDTENTHGTGCTLSSSMAAALSFKCSDEYSEGATNAIDLIDACVLEKPM